MSSLSYRPEDRILLSVLNIWGLIFVSASETFEEPGIHWMESNSRDSNESLNLATVGLRRKSRPSCRVVMVEYNP